MRQSFTHCYLLIWTALWHEIRGSRLKVGWNIWHKNLFLNLLLPIINCIYFYKLKILLFYHILYSNHLFSINIEWWRMNLNWREVINQWYFLTNYHSSQQIHVMTICSPLTHDHPMFSVVSNLHSIVLWT